MPSEPTAAPRRVALITGTRADWGLLSPVVAALAASPRAIPLVVATNMHVMARYGSTASEIEAEGVEIAAHVPMTDPAGDPLATTRAMGECIAGMGDAFARLRPDVAVILGDRFEMLAAASAALVMGIPIAHIAGGEQTLGAIDDRMRHAITQMASLHFTETEAYRKRVIAMGADPDRAFNVGALGVANAMSVPVLSRDELAASVGLDFERPTLLVTFHAATADSGSPTEQFGELLSVFSDLEGVDILITYPNNDPRSAGLIEMLEAWAASQQTRTDRRVVAIPSLGKRRYLSALRYVSAVVGNSSSGIIEVPSAGIPTVNIGSRQAGRIAAASVIHCEATRA
ncbi:MAG: UDP-N-acetylglucosamine 2-epimerase, partial [Candidatus Amulumruptor caecigallinarius]|nr:UDP-N-acetylglucosamine 2-epimerase [Candidatus Amulumruptor caecigallinarius]MCM1454054.1 UDP-N-acetylglucosamine 2-epimerase [bacterium]